MHVILAGMPSCGRWVGGVEKAEKLVVADVFVGLRAYYRLHAWMRVSDSADRQQGVSVWLSACAPFLRCARRRLCIAFAPRRRKWRVGLKVGMCGRASAPRSAHATRLFLYFFRRLACDKATQTSLHLWFQFRAGEFGLAPLSMEERRWLASRTVFRFRNWGALYARRRM